jgi:hypothetical protein
MELYKQYLGLIVGTTCSTGLNNLLSDEIIENMFNFQRAPKNFHFQNYYDMTKLVLLIDMPIVLLFCSSFKKFTESVGQVVIKKVFDTRLTHDLYNSRSEKPLFYLFTGDKDLYYLGRDCPPGYSCNWVEGAFMAKSVGVSRNCCWLKQLQELFAADAAAAGHECDPECPKNLLALCLNSKNNVSRRLDLSFPVAIVSHVSTDIWRRRPHRQLFVTLGVLPDADGAPIEWEKVRFVGVTYDGLMYQMTQQYAKRVLDRQNEALKRYKAENHDDRPKATTGEVKLSKKQLKKKRKFQSHLDRVECRCKFCVAALSYSEKQLSFGPQKLHTNKLTLFDFLKVFNLDTELNRSLILKCCALSFGTLDFESYSQETKTSPLENNPRDIVTDTQLGSSNVPLVTQKPVLFAHLDGLDAEDGGEFHVKLFHVTRDNEYTPKLREYIEHLMERKQLLVARKTTLLEPLLTFVAIMKAHHKAFYLEEKKMPPEQVRSSFAAGLFGTFEQNIHRLIGTFKIYTFNGAAYDHILLARNIYEATKDIVVPGPGKSRYAHGAFYSDDEDYHGQTTQDERDEFEFLRERKRSGSGSGSSSEDEEEEGRGNNTRRRGIRVSMSREGSRVNTVILNGAKIGFFDIKKFLPPNASLASFAKMTGCGECKGMFPFEQLTSYDYLVRTTSLPSDPKLWRSRLTDREPTREMVQACLEDFERLGCATALDYLEKYLILDVKLLMQATVTLFRSFFDQVGNHPITSHKNSLSSFSYNSLQSFLMRSKSPGAFIPNHPQIFSLLRSALLGGVSLVCRTDGGKSADSPINAHLGSKDQAKSCFNERPRYIFYYDVNSLYGHAGKLYCSLVLFFPPSH